MKRIIIWGGVALVFLLLVMQLIPLNKTNPAVVREVNWDTPQTRALVQRACFDCHSNETVWPWYVKIAPVSFIMVNHVSEGREELNFSDWTKPNVDFREIQEAVSEGEMPTWDYLLMHASARLTPAETDALLAGLQTTFQQDPPISRR